MKAPDAGEIKNEIEEISSRIDTILKTVKKYYPITETEAAGKTSPADKTQQDESTCHFKQKPDQEA
ncbi:MAG: hypothetical protein K9J79_04235 [Desulfobacteraceae bacterium]|nr:hypothetical protein [Desulfobacteraceae bacterium]